MAIEKYTMNWVKHTQVGLQANAGPDNFEEDSTLKQYDNERQNILY
jgi:hypothetical protein